jgi:diguanylate cyclase (GGDEF)-like protein
MAAAPETASSAAEAAPPVAPGVTPSDATEVATTETTAPEGADLVSREEIVEAMYRAALRQLEIAEARDRAATERDSIANARDRAATERDSIANARDRAIAEREASPTSRVTAAPADASRDENETALERARLEALLQRAHLDPLTGAFRREMGRLALRNEIERARRADGSFVLAFIDVDGLKGVNDENGHAAGDHVLRTLVAIMRANLRSYDPIVRYGGDEFVCGIGSIDPAEVQHRIGVMDQSLRNATGVGITAGLASLTSNESLEELTARADAALLEAKRRRDE